MSGPEFPPVLLGKRGHAAPTTSSPSGCNRPACVESNGEDAGLQDASGMAFVVDDDSRWALRCAGEECPLTSAQDTAEQNALRRPGRIFDTRLRAAASETTAVTGRNSYAGRARRSRGTFHQVPMAPSTTAALRWPAQHRALLGDPLNAIRKSSSGIARMSAAGVRASFRDRHARRQNIFTGNSANFFHGQTSWQMSHPYRRSPIFAWGSRDVALELIGDTRYRGSGVEHVRFHERTGRAASRQRVRIAAMIRGERRVGFRSRSSNSEPRKKNEPARGWISVVFLPNQPNSARRADRAPSGPVSTYASVHLATDQRVDPLVQFLEPRPHHVVIVSPRAWRDQAEG